MANPLEQIDERKSELFVEQRVQARVPNCWTKKYFVGNFKIISALKVSLNMVGKFSIFIKIKNIFHVPPYIIR